MIIYVNFKKVNRLFCMISKETDDTKSRKPFYNKTIMYLILPKLNPFSCFNLKTIMLFPPLPNVEYKYFGTEFVLLEFELFSYLFEKDLS